MDTTTIIILCVVAVILVAGGATAFFVLRNRKKNADADNRVAVDSPQKAEEEAAPEPTPAVTEKSEAAGEPDTERDDNADSGDDNTNTDADSVANSDDENTDEVTRIVPIEENGKTRRIVVKYSKSFLAKLIQSDERTKRYYSELKNKLLLYDKVKSRITWKCETFRKGRKTLAKLRLRGKTLTVALALDPDNYIGTEYRVESRAEIKSYMATPCVYRIKNNRRLAYSKELIEELATKNDLTEKTTVVNMDYAAQYPYEETDALIERKLIKVLNDKKQAKSESKLKPSEVRAEVAATEVDKIMSDEVAESLIEKSDGKIDKTKQGIINIDTLSQNFESGEIVTLDDIKKRVKGFNQKTTYIKVLARGTLDKPLTVEADTFSIQAVKMIVLTGGKVIKKR